LGALAFLLAIGLGIWISYPANRTAIVQALIRVGVLKTKAQLAWIALERPTAKDEADLATGIQLRPHSVAYEFFDTKG
jgi:hypothetical protein